MQIHHQKAFKPQPTPNHIIIDTDAGGDDVQAIILAVSQAKKSGKTIIGITCVDGNAAVDDVVRNVLVTLSVCKVDIPVYKGCNTALIGPTHKDHYFSEDGLGGMQAKFIQNLSSQKAYRSNLYNTEVSAVDFIIESSKKYKGDLAIIGLGPLTNLAMAYHLDNEVVEGVSMLSIMGGTTSMFGIRQFFAAEFNFYLDPQAAKIVLKAYKNIFMSSFDVSFDLGTQKTYNLFTETVRQKAHYINLIHSVILSTHKPAVCDPIAVIPVFCPDLIELIEEVSGQIEVVGKRTRGAFAIDWWQQGPQKVPEQHLIKVLTRLNLDGFINRISDSYN